MSDPAVEGIGGTESRLPPAVLRRPYWAPWTRRAALLIFSLIFVWVGSGFAAAIYAMDNLREPAATRLCGLSLTAGLSGGLLTVFVMARRRQARSLAEVIQTYDRNAPVHPSGQTLFAKWFTPRRPPAGIFEAVLDPATGIGTRAQIICLGDLSVPAGDGNLFEPAIITPVDQLRTGLLPLIAWGGFCAMFFVSAVVLHRDPKPVLVLVLFGAARALPLLLPTYVRLAPGVVQFVRYGLRGRRLKTSTFEMTAGTIAVIKGRRCFEELLLIRDQDSMTLKVRGFDEQIWRSLLSTAPIPTMSETELTG